VLVHFLHRFQVTLFFVPNSSMALASKAVHSRSDKRKGKQKASASTVTAAGTLPEYAYVASLCSREQ